MPRRASSKNPTHHYLLLFALILALATLTFFYLGKTSDPYRTLPTLDIPTYYANANSLRGNTYKIRASIKNSIAWSPTHGRIISILTLNQDNKESDPLPIIIPKNFDSINLQRGQQYHIKAEVGDRGLLIARDLKKI